MNKLEKNLVATAKGYLHEARTWAEDDGSSEHSIKMAADLEISVDKFARREMVDAMQKAWAITQLAMLADNGLCEAADNALTIIESEVAAIKRVSIKKEIG